MHSIDAPFAITIHDHNILLRLAFRAGRALRPKENFFRLGRESVKDALLRILKGA